MSISIRLIGSLRVERTGETMTAATLGSPKARQVLEILALQPGIAVSRDRMIELLWGGHPPATARATLESYVSVIRKHIQPGQAKTGPLRTENGCYFLDPRLVHVDLDRFERLAGKVDGAKPAEAYAQLLKLLDMATAPLLSDELTVEWAEEARHRHEALVVDCRIRAAEAAAALGKHDDAVHWAQRAVASEPLNERAWTVLVGSLEQSGRYTEALQAYDRYRISLRRDLGCNPGEALQAAYSRLLRQTSSDEADLAELLSALLCLNEHVKSRSLGHRPAARIPGVDSVDYVSAGNLIGSFLDKALAVV
ncbi:response regulator receiver/SARP domain-containing protein [Arthrobacter crystallopoietes BAB-32]|uniref:Response regulator receiver/SARP domain-containing protein n=1 Tax=Arthrobacter crystallopoietes BAB-32 TaxID=1246476 RepID=N1UZN1_9MICC|nr:BTAD domain-containing putative transcriptional regulator [Arthrobacter crystallopoietes]EMY33267.1 response regulator receiver/SARP domain-containing protein [Arthrobacter crystallopoietes BAB-32]